MLLHRGFLLCWHLPSVPVAAPGHAPSVLVVVVIHAPKQLMLTHQLPRIVRAGSDPKAQTHNNTEKNARPNGQAFSLCWHLPIVPGRFQPSIVGTSGLNCRVRDGNGCTPTVIDTNYISTAFPPVIA